MAEVIVAHHPELTPEHAMEVFRRHFGDRYDVHKTILLASLFRDFVVKKSAWMAAAVKLKQKSNATTFVFGTYTPLPLRFVWLFGVVLLLIPMLWFPRLRQMLMQPYQAMEEEIRSFIRSAPEFH